MLNEFTPLTQVVFRRWRDTGDIIALFPELPADYQGRFCDASRNDSDVFDFEISGHRVILETMRQIRW